MAGPDVPILPFRDGVIPQEPDAPAAPAFPVVPILPLPDTPRPPFLDVAAPPSQAYTDQQRAAGAVPTANLRFLVSGQMASVSMEVPPKPASPAGTLELVDNGATLTGWKITVKVEPIAPA